MYSKIWCRIFIASSVVKIFSTDSIYNVSESALKASAPEFNRFSLLRIPSIFTNDIYTENERSRNAISLFITLDSINVILDLKLNTHILPKSMNQYNSSEEDELCEYMGKVRGAETSRVALSVCGDPAAVQGTVFDGATTYYIEPATNELQASITDDMELYYIYNRRDMIGITQGCGTHGSSEREQRSVHYAESRRTNLVVKVLLVTGASVYRKKGNSKKSVKAYCRGLINEVYSYFLDLGVIVQLAARRQILPRTEKKILDKNSKDSEAPLHRFKDYLLRHDYVFRPYDLAIFLSEDVFLGTKTVGLAYTDSICSGPRESASAVISSSGSWFLTATTVAHEIGHILGLSHEEQRSGISGCPNTGPTHIMTKVGIPYQADWSACTKQFWKHIRDSGRVECLE